MENGYWMLLRLKNYEVEQNTKYERRYYILSKWSINPSTVPIIEEMREFKKDNEPEEVEGVEIQEESTTEEPNVSTDFTKIDWSWAEKGRELQHYSEIYQNAYKEIEHCNEKYWKAYNEYRAALLKINSLLTNSLLEMKHSGVPKLRGLEIDYSTVDEWFGEDVSNSKEDIDGQGN